jgi:hypothetical protein
MTRIDDELADRFDELYDRDELLGITPPDQPTARRHQLEQDRQLANQRAQHDYTRPVEP